MLGFPVPYTEELIYSVVARAGVHAGITSPKLLLETVFEDRKVIPTVDLPSHLSQISGHYPPSLNLTTLSLIYQHTLFPIYAPFVSEAKRQDGIEWMTEQSRGVIHLVFGIVASLVKQAQHLQYCPKCFEEQRTQYGERYWTRDWLVPGVTWCLKHQTTLLQSALPLHHEQRHQFYPANISSDDNPIESLKKESLWVANWANQLLRIALNTSPTAYQWSCYYRDLAVQAGCHRGAYINHFEVAEIIGVHWSRGWLSANHLWITDMETCWAKGILRKHRKSFSFLQHLVVLSSLFGKVPDASAVIESVKQYPTNQPITQKVSLDLVVDRSKRLQWLTLLKAHGSKRARLNGSQGLYMWLYRHDYEWLMKINKRYRREIRYEDKRVNWTNRDKKLVRRLFKTFREHEQDDFSPRLSATYLLARLGIGAMPERKYRKLPLTRQFLFKYSESVTQYQICRLTNEYISQHLQPIQIERWRLLRNSGLSKERLMPLTRCFLQGLMEGIWVTTTISTSPKVP
ncbi:TnsD family Tn7-like transposition protein [Vibrio sp. SCSIO 43136]|uniref:TnsD family Tn7-like transposition protein n=1 Tax=Vibrio sp. SCSIO 43136 TaxID=2819101 RepID=UPI002074AC14|nr:TnsD family Tn7-like transposition protein [Vibrio sp. SCSIO 43136]USD67366.1 TniQ family protein [Vibrio sp. SCSIO 43136]